MAYMMVETSVRTHWKFLAAGPAAAWLWLCGLGYCQDGLTDGLIPEAALDYLGVADARPLAERLVEARLWDSVTGGWRMHDYLHHNKPADVVREIMRLRKAGGKLGGRPPKNLQGSDGADDGHNLGGFDDVPKPLNLPENPVRDGTRRDVTAVTEKERSAEVVDSGPVVLLFPVVGSDGPEWRLRRRQVDEWRGHFPNLDVEAECRKALAWLQANAGRRKTSRGMPRFLVAWLSRAVDRRGGVDAGPAAKSSGNASNLQGFIAKGRPS